MKTINRHQMEIAADATARFISTVCFPLTETPDDQLAMSAEFPPIDAFVEDATDAGGLRQWMLAVARKAVELLEDGR